MKNNPGNRLGGAPKGNRNALKTGRHTAAMKALRNMVRARLKRARAALAAVNKARQGKGAGMRSRCCWHGGISRALPQQQPSPDQCNRTNLISAWRQPVVPSLREVLLCEQPTPS